MSGIQRVRQRDRTSRDARDDNFNAFDFWPRAIDASRSSTTTVTGSGDWPATSSTRRATCLPVERIRRFVTPSTSTGDGRVVTWSDRHATPGADAFGRVGLQQATSARPACPVPAGGDRPPTRPAGSCPHRLSNRGDNATGSPPTFPDLTNNPFHGFDVADAIPTVPRHRPAGSLTMQAGTRATSTADGITASAIGAGNPTADQRRHGDSDLRPARSTTDSAAAAPA